MLFIACLLLVISGCNLTNTASQELPTDVSATVEVTNLPTDLPDSSTPTSTPTIQSSEGVASTDCLIPNPNVSTYTVLSGDTLSTIAVNSGSTVEELAQLNCLEDTNLITVGQQIYVPTTNQNSQVDEDNSNDQDSVIEAPRDDLQVEQSNISIDLSNIPSNPLTYHGAIIPSPWIVNYTDTFIVEEGNLVNLTWSEFPSNLGITEVGFVIRPNNNVGGYTLIGADTNFSDGIVTSWVVPANAQFDVFAVGQIPGQRELIVSDNIRLGARNSSEPLQPRVYGTTSVAPTVNFINPGQVVVDPNRIPITIEWIGPTSFGYHMIDRVSFYHRDNDGVNLIGIDEDESDGISTSFITYPSLSGVIYAEGEFVLSARQVFHVALTMPEIQIDVQIDGCVFSGFGIGSPHPVYPSPDLSTTPIGEIQAMEIYPVIQQGESFHQIELDNQSGWVAAGRGSLIGDC